MSLPAAVYRPRNPQSSDYYRCVEDYFETFVQIYDEQFSRQYGFWRPYIEQVIYRYLDAACPVLVCPKCKGTMRVISAIDDRQVIRSILEHLGLWLVRSRPPPKIHAPPVRKYAAAFGGDMLRKPAGSATCPRNKHNDTIYGDPEYSWDAYIHA